MNHPHEPLLWEDYAEPACPLCKVPQSTPVPLGRIVEKLEEYLGKNDYAAGERHLNYWLAEAEQNGDERGCFGLHNELMGLCRKLGKGEQAMAHAEAALALAARLGQTGAAGGTTLVNAATVCHTFGRPRRALALFEQAKARYEAVLPPQDSRLGGLYNNMALTLVALGEFDRANNCYHKALSIMGHAPHGALEQAITYLNLADAAAAQYGMAQSEAVIGECLTLASALLDGEDLPRNGYYAFVCDKCAPTFDYYGYFLIAEELRERAREIYERACTV